MCKEKNCVQPCMVTGFPWTSPPLFWTESSTIEVEPVEMESLKLGDCQIALLLHMLCLFRVVISIRDEDQHGPDDEARPLTKITTYPKLVSLCGCLII